jgi:hypothetical protein
VAELPVLDHRAGERMQIRSPLSPAGHEVQGEAECNSTQGDRCATPAG